MAVKLLCAIGGVDKRGETFNASAGDVVEHFDAETEKRLVEAGAAEPVESKPKPKGRAKQG